MAQQETQGKDEEKTNLVKTIVTSLISVSCNLIGLCCQWTQTTSTGHLRNKQSLSQEGKAKGYFKFTCNSCIREPVYYRNKCC